MTAAPAYSSVRHSVAEIQRLRAQLDTAHQELAQLRAILATPDPMTEPAYWRALFRDAHLADCEAAYRRGREDEGREMAAAWNAVARPIARGGPSFEELERRRWALRGEQRTRATFGEPHLDDYRGKGGQPT